MKPVPVSSTDPTLLDRLRRVMPLVQRLIGKVRVVGIVSAISAGVLWAILFSAIGVPLSILWPLTEGTALVRVAALILVPVVLFAPAAGTWLAVLTMREVLALPDRLRALPGRLLDSAGEATTQATSVAVPPEGEGRSGRLFGFFAVLWRLREVVGDLRGTLARTVALARAVRLASLPFVLLLSAAFALNFVVMAVAAIAVLVVLVP